MGFESYYIVSLTTRTGLQRLRIGFFLPLMTTTMTEREIYIHESEVIGHILTDLHRDVLQENSQECSQ